MLKKEYFKNYKRYNTYYKASVIINDEFKRPEVEILKSYDTNIVIYNKSNGNLILNRDYYNCSKTTKEQLEFYLINKFIVNKIYLETEQFNKLTNYIIVGDVGAYELAEHEIFKTFIKDLELLEIYKSEYLTIEEKINAFIGKPPKTEKQILKTRFKIIEYLKKSNITIKIIKIWRGTPDNCKYNKNDLLNMKIKLVSETSTAHDHRNQKEKVFYGGADLGITNTKNLKPVKNYYTGVF